MYKFKGIQTFKGKYTNKKESISTSWGNETTQTKIQNYIGRIKKKINLSIRQVIENIVANKIKWKKIMYTTNPNFL